MGTLYIPSETDFKRWVKEAVEGCLQQSLQRTPPNRSDEDDLLNRKEIARILRISLVTLTDWMKHGLPFHKQRSRVYFLKSEVLDYIKENKIDQFKFSLRFQTLRQETA